MGTPDVHSTTPLQGEADFLGSTTSIAPDRSPERQLTPISQPAPHLWMWYSPLVTPEFVQWVDHQQLGAQISSLHPKRQTEYLAGRHALIQLYRCAGIDGIGLDDLSSHADGQVDSPAGYVCTLSHGYDRIVAMVADQRHFRSIGVDVEEVVQLRRCSRLLSRVAPHDEQSVWQRAGMDDDLGLTLTFSAKEALYKALTASVSCIMHFGQATLGEIDPVRGRLTLVLTKDLNHSLRCGRQFELQYRHQDQEILTWALLT